MHGYNFTDHTRNALIRAREHAGRLGNEYVSPDHILLGIISSGEGVASTAIVGLGVQLPALQAAIEARVVRGEVTGSGLDIPYTSRAKKVLEAAMVEARELNHRYVGTEHLLLGVLREEKTVAAEVLVQHGLSIDRVRAEVRRLLGVDDQPAQTDHAATDHSPRGLRSVIATPVARSGGRLALLISVIALLVAITALVIALSGR